MKRLVVVISSTALDLPEHRREVMAACLSVDCVPKMMEHLPAVDADAIQASLDLVNQADVYLGVFAYRYGYIPKGHDLSITEMELLRAEERHIPCIAFLINKDHPVTIEHVETGPSTDKLNALKARLGTERVVGFFSSPADLRAKVLQSLVALRDKLNAEAKEGTEPGLSTSAEVDRPPPSIENNPYRSLSAFREEDAAVFFGRDALIRETLATFYGLIDPSSSSGVRLLAILGPSGSGKSSFARAGLAAQLNQRAEDNQSSLRVVTMIPGEHPMAALTRLVRDAFSVEHPPSAETVQDSKEDADTKDHFPSPLKQLAEDDPKQPVLLVDQFEEVYSLCKSDLEQNAFVEALVTAASEPGGRVSVILTMRTDFLGETQRHSELNAAIAKHSIIVPAMSAQDLRLAITEPAVHAGRQIGEGTVGRPIDETIGREGVLPLLQFTLSAIWQGMASDIAPAVTVNRLGGVGRALASRAEQLYQTLSEQDRQIARRAFLGMVYLRVGAQVTRRRVPITKLVANYDVGHVLEVLEWFAKPERRLVTLSVEGEQAVAEVTHEALFAHWSRLQQWLTNGRDAIRFQRRLEEAADEWQALGKPNGLLWRPPLLSLLYAHQEAHSDDMRPLDHAFYEASDNEQQRELNEARNRRRWNWAVALTVIVGLSGIAVWQYVALEEERARRRPIMPDMVVIDPGQFQMGSPESDGEAYSYELPQHAVTLSRPFAIGKYEVTFEEYDKFAYDTDRRPPSDSGFGGGRRPVINVSWHDARAYATWLSERTGQNYRLPSEAEWEYATRAGTTSRRFWGDAPEDACRYASVFDRGSEASLTPRFAVDWAAHECEDGFETTAPVGSFEPNSLRLHDMLGNVWEWVEDCWHDGYQNAPEDGRPWLDSDGGNCSVRVLRGGSWYYKPRNVRSANRNRYYPDFRNFNVGFRLAQDLD